MFLPQSVHPKLSQPSSDHGSFHPATAQDLGICLLATEKIVEDYAYSTPPTALSILCTFQ